MLAPLMFMVGASEEPFVLLDAAGHKNGVESSIELWSHLVALAVRRDRLGGMLGCSERTYGDANGTLEC